MMTMIRDQINCKGVYS